MSSLHQEPLLAEGSEPVPTLAPARGTSRTPAAEKATSTVPTQRLGTAQPDGTSETTPADRPAVARTRRPATATAAGALAARAKAAGTATRRVASARVATVSAKAATVKAARATTATSRTAATPVVATPAAAVQAAATPAAAKPAVKAAAKAVAKPAAAKGVAKPAAAKPAAEPAAAGPAVKAAAKPAGAAKRAATAAAKPAAAKPAAKPTAKPAAAKPAATKPAAERPAVTAPAGPARVRPTPHKRTVPAAQILAALAEQSGTTTTAPATSHAAPEATEGRASRFLRRPPSIGRRPSLYLAAALISALGVSGIASNDPTAQATDTMSHSVSVAEELGIEATPVQDISETDATELLGELAASRNERGAEQAAAAQVQANADQAAAAAAAEAARPKAVLPVQGARLTSTFGARWGTLHAGIDLAAPMQTPEYAAMDGVVLEAGPASGFGLAVYIQHENGDVTVYGHMVSILVEAGQVVKAGDTIALLGNRGQSTGPHLHFEVHVGGLNGTKIDPLPWLQERGVQI